MLSEVRFYDSSGKLKKVLSSERLSKAYWKKLNCSQTNSTPMKFGKGKKINEKQLFEEYDYYPGEHFEVFSLEE